MDISNGAVKAVLNLVGDLEYRVKQLELGVEMNKQVSKKDFQLKELQSGALKHLENKPRMDLIAPEMIKGLSNVLTYGATKYSDRNWEKGIPLMTSYGAAMRHLVNGWLSGEDNDQESGLMHLEHAMCNIAMMVTQVKRGRTDLDDRPKKG